MNRLTNPAPTVAGSFLALIVAASLFAPNAALSEPSKADQAKQAEQAKKAEAAKKAEEAKKAEAAKKAEETKKAEATKKAEETKKAEAGKKAEEAKKTEEAKKAEQAREVADRSFAEMKGRIDSFTGQWRRELEGLSHDTSTSELSQRSQKLWNGLVHLKGARCVNHDDVLKISGYVRDSAEHQRIVTNNPKVDTVAILQLDAMLACENNVLVGDLVFTVKWPGEAKKAEDAKKAEQAKKEEETKKAERAREIADRSFEEMKGSIDSFTGQWRRGLEDLSHDTSSNELSQRTQKLFDKFVHLKGAPCVNRDDVLKIAGYVRDSAERQRIVMNNPKVDTLAILQLDVLLACENNFFVGDLVFTVRWPKVTVH